MKFYALLRRVFQSNSYLVSYLSVSLRPPPEDGCLRTPCEVLGGKTDSGDLPPTVLRLGPEGTFSATSSHEVEGPHGQSSARWCGRRVGVLPGLPLPALKDSRLRGSPGMHLNREVCKQDKGREREREKAQGAISNRTRKIIPISFSPAPSSPVSSGTTKVD